MVFDCLPTKIIYNSIMRAQEEEALSKSSKFQERWSRYAQREMHLECFELGDFDYGYFIKKRPYCISD